MQVEIRPLPKKKWHGYTNEQALANDITYEAFVDGESQQYKVEFESEEEREYLEKQTGYDLSLRFDPINPHPTWSQKPFWGKLSPFTFYLDTNRPMDRIQLAIHKGSPLVANSLAEHQNGMWPMATHVIYSQQEEFEAKAAVIHIQNKAVKLAMEMPMSRKLELIRIIDGEDFTGRSPDFVEVKIKQLCDERPKDFIKWAEMDAEDIVVRSLVLEAQYKGALRKDGPSYYYGADRLGIDLDDTVSFLKNPENQAYRIRILEKLGKA